MDLTRRFVLGGTMGGLLAGALPGVGLAEGLAGKRPRARPLREGDAGPQGAEDLVAAADLTGATAFVVADAATGEVLDAANPDLPVPPASVAKAITTLYALDRLGPGRVLTTRVLATGPVAGGLVQGDLILAGGGDATLDTDELGDLAARLRGLGLRGVTGRYLVWAGALPALQEIAADQPVQVGYNPGLSGLMLDFGRVYFEWKSAGEGLAISMDARGERYAPKIGLTRMELAEREAPLFTYAQTATTEDWTVARPALGREGSRWLPVRRAAPYVAEAFRGLCRLQGIELPAAEAIAALPAGATELARHDSAPLTDLLRGMLRWSTNITAEALGLAASGAPTLAASGAAMSDWAAGVLGGPGQFHEHSGLGSETRVTAAGMARALRLGRARTEGAALTQVLRDVGMRDAAGKAVKGSPIRVLAKTGTLNFTSGLAGFIQPPGGREMVFAIFSADPARRAALPMSEREEPKGGKAWLGRARRLQGQLIHRWVGAHA